MSKLFKSVIVAAIACAMALCVGCSSSSGSASAESSAASQEASASVQASDQAASAEAAASAAAGALDPANLAPGEYAIDVTLEGGSGKASIDSPAQLLVTDQGITMTVVWSSPNYDLMVVDGTEYAPVPRTGNSTFQIPVKDLTQDMPVQAETTAMSEPHMIDYVIHFDASTLQ